MAGGIGSSLVGAALKPALAPLGKAVEDVAGHLVDEDAAKLAGSGAETLAGKTIQAGGTDAVDKLRDHAVTSGAESL